MMSYYLAVLSFFTVSILFLPELYGSEIGKLHCTESGLYPDDKLIGLIMQKCQPKLDDPRDMLVACLTKCIMKQMKALNKKGRMKQAEAKKLAEMLPDNFQEEAKSKFDGCFEEHDSNIKKESKCDSWIPFSGCYIGFAESLCKQNMSSTTPSA